MVYSEFVKSEGWNPQKEATNNVIGVPWRRTDGRWTEVREDPILFPPLPFEGARIQRDRITKQDIENFGATFGCQGCDAIKDNEGAQAHSDRCRERIERSQRRQQPVTVDSKGRRGQSQTRKQERMPEIRWKWSLVKAQRHSQQCQQAPGEGLS